MKKMRLKLINGKKIMLYTFLVSFILLFIISTVKWIPYTSLGADTTTVVVEATLEKYINYYLSEQDKGTLVQYEIKNKVEYGEAFLPVTKSEVIVNLVQIDEQYPSEVKVITESTVATNGKTSNFENFSQYDSTTGTLLIQTNNQNENGDLIRQEQPDGNNYDSYIVICYYNTYTEEKKERELNTKVTAKATLANEENTQISREEQCSNSVTENIGELTSIYGETQDIYNGYMKSNVINGTNYATQYEQKEQIMVSKKEAQTSIEISENNTLVKTQENIELGNNKNLVYKSTEIQEKDIKGLLGEEGILEILDTDYNVIATINKDIEFNENGSFVVYYENELESIIIRTSNIVNEGILNLKHSKEIKSTMTDFENVSIKTMLQMKGMENSYEIVSELKDAETQIDMSINNVNWSNNQQNEVTFDVYLDASSVKNNMFKNPALRIELPSQVKKVILGSSSIIYANGLELQEPYLTTNENGNLVIVAELKGEQTEYKENLLESITNVKIVATVILNKNIESTNEIVKLAYSNQYTLDGNIETGNKEIKVQLESYKEENITTEEEKIIYNTAQTMTTNSNDLKMEVAPTKGNTTIKNGDVVYEGEYIKYNIKITNTSNQDIDNVKVVATIPEGTVYGELETDYYNYRKSYKYKFNEELAEKTIEVGTVKAGESKTTFYEVKVKDLADGEEGKSIVTNLNSYIGEELVQNYEITNTIKPSEAQLFMNSLIDYGGWTYGVNLMSEKEEEVDVKVHLPQNFQLEQIIYVSHNVEDPIKYEATPEDHGVTVYTNYNPLPEGQEQIRILAVEVSRDNIITTKLKANCYYEFVGKIDTTNFDKQADIATVVLPSYTEAIINNNTYTSNENRVEVAYENVEVSMTSSNEGEKVKYEEEIDYEITIKNIGGNNVVSDDWVDYTVVKVSDFLPEEVEAVSVTYNNWKLEEREPVPPKTVGEKYVVKEEITKDISGKETNEKGEKLANVDISILIPKGETATIKVKTTAGFVYAETRVENSVTVSGDKIDAKTTNTITHTILPYNYGEENNPENPGNPDNSDNPGNPDNPSNPDDPNNPNEKYSISGIAWIDENEDGKRSSEEKLLTGMTVMLVDIKVPGTVKNTTKTNDSGMYLFSDLEEGNYLVVFRYDTNNYQLTEYQKSGVNNSLNSDAISKTITLNGEQTLVGITDTIELNKSVTNIDVGLIENKLCDFKIDKYISKVTVRTTSGIREYNYGNQSLAKAEIKAKEVNGATVVIEYKIIITNVGEIAGTVNKIVDYLPDELSFSSDLNKNWAKSTNGKLTNTSNSNKKIKPGESIELTLIATKQMNSDSTGTFKNKVEIDSATSITGIADANAENNSASADVIISISTGAIVYITIIISILGILSLIGICLYKKGKINIKRIRRTTFLMMFFVVILFVQSSNAIAASVYNSWYFDYDEIGNIQYHRFWGGPTGVGYCMNHSLEAYDGTFSYWYAYDSYYTNERTTSTGDFTLTRENSNIPMRVLGSNFIYGPFKYSCTIGATYSCTVYDQSGNTISGATICNSSGSAKNLSGSGDITFYLKIPQSSCSNGLAKVELTAGGTVSSTIAKDLYVQGAYYLSAIAQSVRASGHVYAGTTTSTSRTKKTKKITWTDINGSLEIIKVDKDDNSVKLPTVQFKVTCSANNYDKTFTTDTNGEIHIYNLKRGTYNIKEISNPHYGYEATASGSATVTKGKEVSKVIKNEKQTGNLRIYKKDSDNNMKLKGMTFNIRNSKGEYVIAVNQSGTAQTTVTGAISLGNMQFTTNENNATKFITNDNGVIEIKNILKDTYTIKEISVGDNYYGYEVDGNYISWEIDAQDKGTGITKSVEVKRQTSINTKPNANITDSKATIVTIKNKRKYVMLTGYVWEDFYQGKTSERNDLYDGNGQDKLLEHVMVKLKDGNGKEIEFKKTRNGNTVTEVETNTNGSYEMWDIIIDDMDKLYIEFTYNGMSYGCVKVGDLKQANTSKASEGSERSTFNEKYHTITKGQSNNANGSKTYDLIYDVSDYKSTIRLGDKNNLKYGYTGQQFPINGVYGQYKITSTTLNACNGYLNKIKSIEEIRKSTDKISKVENINLGLYKRTQPDLTLIKDLYRIKVGINGQTHIYNYGDRFNKNLYTQYNSEGKSGYDMNPQVKFGSKYGSMSYKRALYASDIKYTGTDSLKVYVTYRIGIKNTSSELKMVVNEIVDYMDTKYEFISVGRAIDGEGNIIGEKLTTTRESSGSSQYQKEKIQTNLQIASQSEASIYIQLQVKPNKIVEILGNNDQEVKLDNIAEITSYSTKDASGNTYAGIDIDSQPGNIELTNIKTYEDDTDKAPGLKLVLQEERKVSGQVFEDVTDGTFTSGKIRQGDGKLTSEDKGIAGITVRLVNAQTGQTAQIYNGTSWVEAVTTTGNNGEYTIGGFIPDNYKLVYTWGDSHYKVQDYKSTTVDKTSYNEKSSNLEWYKDEFKKKYPNVEWSQSGNSEIRVSEAVDNYTTRQKIDKQTNMITNSNKDIISNYNGEIEQKDGSKEALITQMDSATPNFKVSIEYYGTSSNAREEYQLNNNGEIVMRGIYAVKQSGKENYLRSIDFGIVERARQVLSLDKQVKNIKITLANGSVLINAKVVKDEATGRMKFENDVKHAAYIPDSAGAKGQVKLEIDNEIIQGAKLEIEYALQVSNISELEYLNQEYYLYGKGYGQNDRDLVTLKASDVIDYLDNNIGINVEENQLGEIIQDSSRKTELIDRGLLGNTTSMKELLKETTKIMLINQLATDLKPVGTRNVATQTEILLKTYKLLSNTSGTEEMTFDNDAEIIKIEKTGGSSLITTPGNYIPNLTPSEYDDDSAEMTSIIPPTGLSIDYIAYTILGISSLGILIAGIILIKKFVLRRK